PALRASGVARAPRGRLPARGSGAARAQRARTGGPVGPRDLGRPADRARPRRRAGRPPARAAGPPGTAVLAPEGALGRRRHPERAPRQLPRRDAPGALDAAAERALGGPPGPLRGSLPAAGRFAAAGRARPAGDRRPGGLEWRAGRAGRSARPPRLRARLEARARRPLSARADAAPPPGA